MHKFKRVLKSFSWQERGFLLLGVLLFFPYQPLFYLGEQAGANLEISLLQLGLALFCGLSVHKLWKNCGKLVEKPIVWLGLALVSWNAVSLLWTPNKLRGALATGLIVVIFTTFISLLTLDMRKMWRPFIKTVVATAIFSGIFAIWPVSD
jgi:hypothetical protein